VVQNDKLHLVPLDHTGRNKVVEVVPAPFIDDTSSIARMVANHVSRGAKVLVIRNTVRGCVELQATLETMVKPDQVMSVGGTAVPHHGRFVAEDRLQLDQAIENFFGKGSPSRGIVAVGTQTIEQSLDIDADILITDACPIDVLLQRLGRLHRHQFRTRPDGYAAPLVVVLTPENGFSQYMTKAANGFGRDRAYANVLSVMATVDLVTKAKTLSIPDDNRRFVELATHPEALQKIVDQQPELARYHNAVQGKQIGERSHAAQKSRSETWRYGDSLGSNWESAPTRLGEPSIRIEFDRQVETFLGNSISGISIPHWMLEGYEFPIDGRKCEVLDKSPDIIFWIGTRKFSYTRFGLEIMREEIKPA
jgi:CRISPR-associated endonuclease/helicase Cas3